MDVHRALARVPTVRQNTADDNDNDTLGNGHRADVRRPMPHGTGSVKVGNACLKQKLETSKWKVKRQEFKTMNHFKNREQSHRTHDPT